MSLTSFPGWQHFTLAGTTLLGDLGGSCVTRLGEDSWNLIYDFP